ncbi:MAG: hypothetical protein FWG98_08020 [Candidatus Cloacimonetes bacterium]|nr:hypothetical protein [Candidatus Cloacimonadota bacterium]
MGNEVGLGIFAKINRKGQNSQNSGTFKKWSSMYTLTEIAQGIPFYALNKGMFTPPPPPPAPPPPPPPPPPPHARTPPTPATPSL